MDKDKRRSFIEKKLEEIQRGNSGHLHIMMNYGVELNDLKSLITEVETTEYCFMSIEPKKFTELKIKDECTILKADTDEILRDGYKVEVQANKVAMGEEFAIKRSKRKIEVYKENPNLNLYVCYKEKEPIGTCELFIKDGIAKIEDFDIIEEYQKQGYGTSVLHKLLEESFHGSVDIAYVITDNFDTAKNMYRKCGFSICGVKTSILFIKK